MKGDDICPVIGELSYFANITLSSFYFDINKDCLYADRVDGVERRRVLTVLDEVLTTMTRVLAPVLPHLAEEIHATLYGPESQSVFATPWTPLVRRRVSNVFWFELFD